MNEIRFGYNKLRKLRYLVGLNSLSFIADSIYTLDNRRLVLPFDYAGRGLVGDKYVEEAYNEDGYRFAS